MAEKLGFDLPANFAHKAVADLVMDSEQFEHAQAMLMKSNRMLALGGLFGVPPPTHYQTANRILNSGRSCTH